MAADKDESECILDEGTRVIYLTGDITPESSSQFRRYITQLEKESLAPIEVEINSKGGDISAGLTIIDSIRRATAKVITRVAGEAESIAAVILASGKEREAMPSSVIMLHEGSYDFGYLTMQQLKIEMQEAQRLELVCNVLLEKFTGIEAGKWDAWFQSGDMYLDPFQAKAYKLIDKVLE